MKRRLPKAPKERKAPPIERACITCTQALPISLRVDKWHLETNWPQGHQPSGVWRVARQP